MDIFDIKQKLDSKERIQKIARRVNKNDVIADYYMQLAEETGVESYNGNAARISCCAKNWVIDFYQVHGIKDIKRIDLCHDRFCDNCQNAQSVQRERKFAPVLDFFAPRYDIYHMVFTVPNVYPEELLPSLDRMYNQIGYIFRLFRGNAKIRGYDFRKYRYLGAIRALEITKGRDGKTFHPHFHCLFILRKGVKFEGSNVNSYSFDNPDVKKSHHKKEYGKPERYFTDFEILIQKIWRLRYDGVRVNVKNIAELKEGYSVICEKRKKGDYKEVFKYALKGIFKKGDITGGYNDFEPLALALKNRRVIQGYGILRSFDFEFGIDQDDIDATKDLLYSSIIHEIRKKELPSRMVEGLYDILRNAKKNGDIKYISRNRISEIMAEDYDK